MMFHNVTTHISFDENSNKFEKYLILLRVVMQF